MLAARRRVLIGTQPGTLALAAAGVLLMNRKMATRAMLGTGRLALLILLPMFIVNPRCSSRATSAGSSSTPSRRVRPFTARRTVRQRRAVKPGLQRSGHNALLPSAVHPLGGLIALSSTLAGNLLIVGSIANIIVVDQASRLGLSITWRDHARVGGPVTLLTLAVAAAWLALLV